MSNSVLTRARNGRVSPAVLRARVVNARSRDAGAWIFVYEGLDDVGVYEEWIGSIDQRLSFIPIIGCGKDQVLAFRDSLGKSSFELRYRTLFFVDQDFDGLKGYTVDADIFCTKKYSIENYVVCEDALRSILLDEFRCAHDGENAARAISQFRLSYSEFLSWMRDANLRIYAARATLIQIGAIEEKIHKYISVGLLTSNRIYTQNMLSSLIPIANGQTLTISPFTISEFDKLDPQSCYRGKFAFGFFKRWVELLFEDRRSGNPILFSRQSTALAFSPNLITLRTLASRTRAPVEFHLFVRRAKIRALKMYVAMRIAELVSKILRSSLARFS